MSDTRPPSPAIRRWRRAVFRLNAPLVLGGLLVGLIVLCAIAAPLIAPFDPYDPKLFFDEGRMLPTPYPPGTRGMLLGSDVVGRDILSRLIYGSRYTLLFCGVAALLRELLAVVLGMLAGWYDRASPMFDVLVGAWSAMPSLIFAIAPIAIVSVRGDLTSSVVTFLFALSLTGWAESMLRIRVEVRSLRATPFVEAAHAAGLRRSAILGAIFCPTCGSCCWLKRCTRRRRCCCWWPS